MTLLIRGLQFAKYNCHLSSIIFNDCGLLNNPFLILKNFKKICLQVSPISETNLFASFISFVMTILFQVICLAITDQRSRAFLKNLCEFFSISTGIERIKAIITTQRCSWKLCKAAYFPFSKEFNYFFISL